MASLGKDAALLGRLLEDIDIAMLTTVGADGYLVSRPLSTQQARFDGKRVWFFTEADSPKVGEIQRNPRVNLAYVSPEKNTYVSLAGRARLSRDRARINALWSDAMKAFFPGGKDDPNLVLLEVTLRSAEYWEGPSTLLGKLVTFVIARVTGDEEVMGENRLVDLAGKRRTSRLPPSHKDARPARARKAAKVARKAPAKKATPTARPRASAARRATTPAARKPVRAPAKAAARKATTKRATKRSTR